MKRKLNSHKDDAGERFLDHNNSETIVSLIHNHSDVCYLAITAMRNSVPREYGLWFSFISVGPDKNSIGMVDIVGLPSSFVEVLHLERV